jgi:hypothetical protein
MGKKRNLTRRLLIDYFAAERIGLPAREIEHTLSVLSEAVAKWNVVLEYTFFDNSQKQDYLDLRNVFCFRISTRSYTLIAMVATSSVQHQ